MLPQRIKYQLKFFQGAKQISHFCMEDMLADLNRKHDQKQISGINLGIDLLIIKGALM